MLKFWFRLFPFFAARNLPGSCRPSHPEVPICDRHLHRSLFGFYSLCPENELRHARLWQAMPLSLPQMRRRPSPVQVLLTTACSTIARHWATTRATRQWRQARLRCKQNSSNNLRPSPFTLRPSAVGLRPPASGLRAPASGSSLLWWHCWPKISPKQLCLHNASWAEDEEAHRDKNKRKSNGGTPKSKNQRPKSEAKGWRGKVQRAKPKRPKGKGPKGAKSQS